MVFSSELGRVYVVVLGEGFPATMDLDGWAASFRPGVCIPPFSSRKPSQRIDTLFVSQSDAAYFHMAYSEFERLRRFL